MSKRACLFMVPVSLAIAHAAVGATLGSVVAWGSNNGGECNPPVPNYRYIGIAGGQWHSLGLKDDGSVVAWGANVAHECDVPSPNTEFIAIAAGAYHSLGLKADGSIVAWGGITDVPSPDTGFIAIAAGDYHNLGLKADGSVVAWGDNRKGQCDVPSPNTGFTAIAGGEFHSLGLKDDGSVVAWGSNSQGQCNVPSNTGFVAIAAGAENNLGLKSDGSVVGWGGSDAMNNVPPPNTDFVKVAAGYLHGLGLKVDGSVVAWGLNDYGQCDVPSSNTEFIAIAGGGFHSLALRRHDVWPPSLLGASEAGPASLALSWDTGYGTPSEYLGCAWDAYAAEWAKTDRADPASMWYPFSAQATSGTMQLKYSGAYHLWISSLYGNGSWFPCDNPWTGIMYSGVPHLPLDVSLEDRGGGQVRLHWRPELYGTWNYQIAVFQISSFEPFAGQWIAVDGPSGLAQWHFVDYGGATYDPAKASFNEGWADFTLPDPDGYWLFIRGAGWLPPYDPPTTGKFAAVFVDLTP